LSLFEQLGAIDESVAESLAWLQTWSMDEHEKIHEEAKSIAATIASKIPVIYTTPKFAPVALRARQQINENSRILCRDHILPEHNHNELLGLQEGNEHVHVLWYEDPDMYTRNAKRVELTKEVLSERNFNQDVCVMNGTSYIQKVCSTMYRIDRLSYYTAMKNDIDPSGMKLIEDLK
jgi:glucose/mannose-6-phosphate isomerase